MRDVASSPVRKFQWDCLLQQDWTSRTGRFCAACLRGPQLAWRKGAVWEPLTAVYHPSEQQSLAGGPTGTSRITLAGALERALEHHFEGGLLLGIFLHADGAGKLITLQREQFFLQHSQQRTVLPR